MITLNYKKWLFMSFILLAVFYACTSEQDYQGNNHKQQIVPLTVLSAKDYYNSVYGSTPRLKNSDDDQVSLTPDWNVGQLYIDSLWDVVESPIEFDNGIKMTLMTSDVSSRLGFEKVNEVKQVLRLVIVRNKETGKTVSFIMAILPGYDYMKQKGDAIYENKYLTRTSDLDGAVLFFGIDGEFVNGWIYENGEIIGYTLSRNSSLGGTKKQSTYCWEQVTSVIDASGQEIEIGRNFYCEESGAGGGVDMSDRGGSLLDGLGNGGIDNNYSDPSSGGGKDPSGQTPTDKKPEIRTDCDNSGADKRSNNAKIIINAVSTNYNNLKGYTSKTNEYSARIDWNGTNYVMSSPVSGGANSASSSIFTNTLYDMHTHTLDSEPPSPKDFSNLLGLNKYYYPKESNQPYNLQGAIIINNNTEYLISIVDRQKAYNFSNGSNSNIFEEPSSGSEIFKNSNINKDFTSICKNLYDQGYTDEQTNYTYAMSYLLDKYNTGLTLSSKKRTESSFKEVKTNYNQANNSYKPTICP